MRPFPALSGFWSDLACGAVFVLAGCVPVAASDAFFDAYAECRAVRQEIDRLRCYDALAVPPDAESGPTDSVEAAAPAQQSTLTSIDADDPNRPRRVNELGDLARRAERGMLQADQPNYFAYTSPIRDDLGDEPHAEFFVSLQYPLLDDGLRTLQDRFAAEGTSAGRLFNALTPDRLLAHYSGLYDFYASEDDPYDSAPIISRLQSPGLSVEYDFAQRTNTLRIGWFHESNGQQLEEDDLPRFRDDRAEFDENFALSQVSRGWDYGQLRWTSRSKLYVDPVSDYWLRYQIETRWFCDCQGFGFIDGREDDIWWEEDNDFRITDIDGLRGLVEGALWNNPAAGLSLDARLELKTGLEHSMGEYISGRLTLGAQFDNLRFTLFYFNGYGRDPSTYHLRTEYTGLGLELR